MAADIIPSRRIYEREILILTRNESVRGISAKWSGKMEDWY